MTLNQTTCQVTCTYVTVLHYDILRWKRGERHDSARTKNKSSGSCSNSQLMDAARPRRIQHLIDTLVIQDRSLFRPCHAGWLSLSTNSLNDPIHRSINHLYC
jgi:hypothetical protein